MTNRNTKHKPKIIAFTLQKGGVGKTSCVVNLAAALSSMKRTKHSRYKNRILIIDMDVHATASRYLGVYDKKRKSIYDALTGKCNFDDIIREVSYEFGRYGICQIDIAPIDVYAATIESKWLEYEAPKYLLSNALQKSNRLKEYDYVFIDCPPESNCLLSNVYNACNYFVLPILPDTQSFSNISITYKQLSTLSTDMKEKNVIGTIINNYEDTPLSRSYINFYYTSKDAEDYKCFETIIPHCKRYDQTLFKKMPVIFYHRNIHKIPPIFSSFMALAKEFNERVNALK